MADELVPQTKDRYDLELPGWLGELAVCKACEDVFLAKSGEDYCAGCCRVRDVLEQMRAEKVRLCLACGALRGESPSGCCIHCGERARPLPADQVQTGIALLPEARPSPTARTKARLNVELLSGAALLVFLLGGWYGIRAVVAFGIWLATR